jgi:hypothetical protein
MFNPETATDRELSDYLAAGRCAPQPGDVATREHAESAARVLSARVRWSQLRSANVRATALRVALVALCAAALALAANVASGSDSLFPVTLSDNENATVEAFSAGESGDVRAVVANVFRLAAETRKIVTYHTQLTGQLAGACQALAQRVDSLVDCQRQWANVVLLNRKRLRATANHVVAAEKRIEALEKRIEALEK